MGGERHPEAVSLSVFSAAEKKPNSPLKNLGVNLALRLKIVPFCRLDM